MGQRDEISSTGDYLMGDAIERYNNIIREIEEGNKTLPPELRINVSDLYDTSNLPATKKEPAPQGLLSSDGESPQNAYELIKPLPSIDDMMDSVGDFVDYLGDKIPNKEQVAGWLVDFLNWQLREDK